MRNWYAGSGNGIGWNCSPFGKKFACGETSRCWLGYPPNVERASEGAGEGDQLVGTAAGEDWYSVDAEVDSAAPDSSSCTRLRSMAISSRRTVILLFLISWAGVQWAHALGNLTLGTHLIVGALGAGFSAPAARGSLTIAFLRQGQPKVYKKRADLRLFAGDMCDSQCRDGERVPCGGW